MASTKAAGHGVPADPYRVFFPLGVLLGLAGVSVWLLYWLGLTAGYSGRAHALIQIEGFLYSFVAGFLLTAIPRFTGTAAPSRPTQYVLAAALLAASVAFEMQAFTLGHGLFLLAHGSVMVLAGQRVTRRRSAPPESFALVGIGMLAGLAAAVINMAVAWGGMAAEWDLLGRRLLTEGMVLLLVLGVGGFLGPRLLGFAPLPEPPRLTVGTAVHRPPLFAGKRVGLYAAAGLAIVLSVVLDYGWGLAAMALLRAAVATTLVLATLKPWQTPAARSTLAWCVWSAHWLVMAGLWLAAVAPAYRVDLLHILFMGGFTLLILAVGMRVVLSHGGHSLSAERRSWQLRVGIATGLFALVARIGAAFAPESFFAHLGIAAFAWTAGILFWGVHIVRLIRSPGVPRRP
jgi:uncharacterized protein involved in response to NO